MDTISRLLRPRSVAIIGASADASKTAGRPVSYLVKHGFAGDIYPVNPKVNRIGDLSCYADIASLPGMLLGMSSFVVALLFEAVREFYFVIIHREEIT